MPLSHLEHFLIQTEDIDKTRDWYVNVLGMTDGAHPDFGFPVCWLYLGEHAVLHVTLGGSAVSDNRMKYLGQQSTDVYGSGVVDHVAFRATGLPEMMSHLDAMGIDYTRRQVDDQNLFQLFLLDPNGVKIELNFAAAEAESITADVIARELNS